VIAILKFGLIAVLFIDVFVVFSFFLPEHTADFLSYDHEWFECFLDAACYIFD